MADKSFGVKDINLIGASGTPTIESPNNLNINAVNVAISTDITVAGKVSLGAGTSISSPAANVLTLGTNSVERVRVTSDGRIGIATDDPNSMGRVSIVVPSTGGHGAINIQNHEQGSGKTNIVMRSLDNNGGNWADAEFRAEGYSFKIRTTERLGIDFNGNVGIGSEIPNAKLEVRDGKIRAGDGPATEGATILEGRYSDEGDILNIFGSHYSNGATVLSYGMRPKNNASGYVSSFDNFNGPRTALEMWGEGAQIVTAPSQQTTVGSDLTSVTAAVMVNNNGDVTMRGTDSQYVEAAAFEQTAASKNAIVANNGGFVSFQSLRNTNTTIIYHDPNTNPSRITFPVAGAVHFSCYQDIITTGTTGYTQVRLHKNGTADRYSLITHTNGQWDTIMMNTVVEVAANDYLEVYYTGGTITSMDNASWLSYNFIFYPINTNR